MIIPILFIGAGTAALIAAIAATESDVEPAAPVSMPDDAPQTPFIPSAEPSADANEVEALARVIASEAGSGSRGEQVAIAWTERNRARAKGKSLYDTFYPWRSQKGGDPPASSARAATDGTRSIAKDVLSQPQSKDPTGGATSFFEPKMQDIFYAAGVMARDGKVGDAVISGVKLTDITRFKNYKRDAAGIRQKWESEGSVLCATAGRFEFYCGKHQFLLAGGSVKTVVGGGGTDPKRAYKDIPDPLALLPKHRRGWL